MSGDIRAEVKDQQPYDGLYTVKIWIEPKNYREINHLFKTYRRVLKSIDQLRNKGE
jgi:hypothetical protein